MIKSPGQGRGLPPARRHPTQSAGGRIRQDVSRDLRNRRSEPPRTFFRCGRYFTVGHEWYVTNREGIDLGPYKDREQAELALAMHVTACCFARTGGIAELRRRAQQGLTRFEALVAEMVGCWEQRRLRSANCAYVWTQQRLQRLYESPQGTDHLESRMRALRYMLSRLDR